MSELWVELTTWIDSVLASLAAVPDFASAYPFATALAIIAATFVHEDAATVAAGIAVSDGVTSVAVALPALYAGIVLGDFGLYGLGRLIGAGRLPQRVTAAPRIRSIKAWLDGRLMTGVFVVRFLPGLRLTAYTAYGFLKAPFGRFALAVLAAAGVWTTGLFYLSFSFGTATEAALGALRWPVILISLLAPLVAVRLLFRARSDHDPRAE